MTVFWKSKVILSLHMAHWNAPVPCVHSSHSIDAAAIAAYGFSKPGSVGVGKVSESAGRRYKLKFPNKRFYRVPLVHSQGLVCEGSYTPAVVPGNTFVGALYFFSLARLCSG